MSNKLGLIVEHTTYTKDLISILDIIPNNDWHICDYGKDGQRVIDDYRVCYKVNYPWTLLINESTLRKELTLNNDIEFKEDEILRYDIGGHFEDHTDRVRGPGHIGTLLIMYPINLKGGELIIKSSEASLIKESLKGSEDPLINKTYDVNTMNTFYIPLDIIHRVNPIISGRRFVFKTSVFDKSLIKESSIKQKTSNYRASRIKRDDAKDNKRINRDDPYEDTPKRTNRPAGKRD